ncbi:unnamed protein product [Nezara viridula]|uniref:Uncharacterized protein n=1 Tax=Nezara viridula TaxID=85310 RepID=A0A9P0H3W5_NEZVI|nr:unnamed protein product [Nezara viridula]
MAGPALPEPVKAEAPIAPKESWHTATLGEDPSAAVFRFSDPDATTAGVDVSPDILSFLNFCRCAPEGLCLKGPATSDDVPAPSGT